MKVGVAMSGGVDSSTTALLLTQQGYDVFGFTCRLDDDYDNPIQKAKQVCQKLGIEHYVVDLQKEFQKEIVDDFNEKIKQGLTPIPCVKCNRIIKFGKLYNFCAKKNAKMATGHYVKITHTLDENGKVKTNIFRAKDLLKDQTHFIYDIDKKIIDNILFPLGDFYKSEIFRIAEENNLIQRATYNESQDVCFFNGKTYNEYVKSLNIPQQQGDIIHITTGKKLGTHNGLLKYTIGQRQGIGVAWSEPLYVVARDFIKNTLFVGEEHCLYSSSLQLKYVNLLVDIDKEIKCIKNNPFIEFNCKVCLRDKTPEIEANIKIDTTNNTAKVLLKTPARAITKGQACVFYVENKLLGGGVII